MSLTYSPITSQKIASDVGVVSFMNIPSNYSDLILLCSHRETRAQKYSYPRMRLNNDSSSNYSGQRLYGSSSGVSANRFSNNSYIINLGECAGSTSPTGEFAPLSMYFLDYSNTTTFKIMLLKSSNPSGDGGGENALGPSLWRSTSAISRIDIYPDPTTGSLIATGSQYSLYGLKGK